MLIRVLVGFIIAGAISLAARRTRSLSRGGAVAATALGTLAMAAGFSWGALLIIYFIASTALSHLRRAHKEVRTASVVAKGGERDAVQVLANGAIFGVAAAAFLVRPNVRWFALAAGSLAASAADTWATEIGTLSQSDPRSILTGRRVPIGTSGGVSLIGTLAMLVGAVFIGAVTLLLGWTLEVGFRVAIGGVFGGMVDSVIGATLQSRRWCDTCSRETERTIHSCRTVTRRVRGVEWIDNDFVNLASASIGGILSSLLLSTQ